MVEGFSCAGDIAHSNAFLNLHASLLPQVVPEAHQLLQTRFKASNHAIAELTDYVATLRAVNSGQEKLKDAIGVYEMEMIIKGEEKVRLSTMNTETVHH